MVRSTPIQMPTISSMDVIDRIPKQKVHLFFNLPVPLGCPGWEGVVFYESNINYFEM